MYYGDVCGKAYNRKLGCYVELKNYLKRYVRLSGAAARTSKLRKCKGKNYNKKDGGRGY